MTDTGAVNALKPGESPYLPWISIVVLWALLQVLVVAVGASPVLEGDLIGTDGFMRLVRVESLHETGAWFDGRIPRSNAPYGDTLHWTRALDLLLLGAAWLATPFLSFENALFWGGSFVSPVLLLASALVMMWAARPLIDAQFRPYVTIAFFAQMAVLSYALPGRVDHHALQFLLLVLSMGMVIRLCTERPRRALAVLTGGVLGIGLWVSVELLLVALLAMTAMWLSWLRFGGGRGPLAAGLAAGLAGSVAVALLIERPIGAIMAEEYDRISIVHLTITFAHFSFWALVLLGERLAGTAGSLRGRLACSLLGAVAGAAVIYAAYPKFFGGAMVDVDPEVIRVYLSKVTELQPIVPRDAQTLGRFLFWVGPAVICLPFVLGMAWVKRNEDTWVAWMYFALALGLYVTLSLRHVRFAPFAEVVAVVPLVYLIGDLRDRLHWITRQTWRDLARTVVSLALIIGVSGAGLALGYRPSPGSRAGGFAVTAPSSGAELGMGAGQGTCDIAAIAAFLNRPRTFGDRSRIIATHVDFGPELLYRTEHAVVGTPYHRNGRGILDIYRIFSAGDPAASKSLLDARGIELVLLCPSPREKVLYASDAQGVTLYERLLGGDLPAWLAPVALPEHLAAQFRLYRVLR